MTVRRVLRAHPEAAAQARALVQELDGRITERQDTDARLLLSEVVTNSVRHAGLVEEDGIEVVLDAGDVLRVEVRDRGAGFELTEPVPDPARPSGWGLYLVQQISDRWGVERGPMTTVWFELSA